jgi:hypothetical protein
MIDNQITIADDKDSEFGALMPAKPKLGGEANKLSWDII